MIDERFIFVGAALAFFGALSYIVDTLKGKAKPNRVTWFLWALAPLIAFSAELDKGVGIQALMTFMVGFNPFLVFLASFVNKKAYWQLHKMDYFYGGYLSWDLFYGRLPVRATSQYFLPFSQMALLPFQLLLNHITSQKQRTTNYSFSVLQIPVLHS